MELMIVELGICEVDGVEKEFFCWNLVFFMYFDGMIFFYYKIIGDGDSFGLRNWWGVVKILID